jgi:hypothetical protein
MLLAVLRWLRSLPLEWLDMAPRERSLSWRWSAWLVSSLVLVGPSRVSLASSGRSPQSLSPSHSSSTSSITCRRVPVFFIARIPTAF